jgi:hypothetical protein
MDGRACSLLVGAALVLLFVLGNAVSLIVNGEYVFFFRFRSGSPWVGRHYASS